MLHVAKHNKMDVVQYLVDELKYDISFETSPHPLHTACELGNALMVKFLIENSANTYEKSLGDNTPLHIACSNGSLEVVQYLVDYGHDTLVYNSKQELPLHIACTKSLDMVKNVSSKCTAREFESKTSEHVTPLHLASSCGFLDVVKYLIEAKNCSPFTLDYFGNNALAYACGLGQLLQGNNISPSVAGYLVKCGCSTKDGNKSPMQISIDLKNLDLFKELVKNEENLNSQDKHGSTSLILLCTASKDVRLWHDSKIFLLDAIKFLTGQHCDQNFCNEAREFSLHIACEHDHVEVVQFLNSSLRDTMNAQGDTPLHIACRNNNIAVFKHLVNNSNCNVVNMKGQSLLHLAMIKTHTEMVRFLFDGNKKIDCSLRDHEGSLAIHYIRSIEVLQLLLDYDDSTIDLLDANGDSILHILCRILTNCSQDCVECLLLHGATVDRKNNHDNNPMHLICSNIGSNLAADIIKCLFSYGARVDIINKDGNTPLHLACYNIKPWQQKRVLSIMDDPVANSCEDGPLQNNDAW